MFDLAAALARHNGQYSFAQLQQLLRQFKRENLGDLSPEVDINDLLRIATQRNWIREDEGGNFHIEVQQAA